MDIDLATQMNLKVEKIIDLNIVDFATDNSLYGGRLGIAIFYIYYAQYSNIQHYYDVGIEIIKRIITDLNRQKYSDPFQLAQLGWVLVHLKKMDLLEVKINKVIPNLNKYLKAYSIILMKNNKYDFFQGVLAISMYFLSSETIESKSYIKHVIKYFEDTSEIDTNSHGIKWRSLLNEGKNSFGYNISLSHGISSILRFFTIAYEKGLMENKYELISKSINYLINQKMTNIQSSIFPNFAIESSTSSFESRLSWCYGDLGISISLLYAAKLRNEKNWEETAISVLSHNSKRRDLITNGIIDAGFCHGTSGISHIYNIAFKNTGLIEFSETSNFWNKKTPVRARLIF
jgi:lantibiotic modifying enzyme